MGSGFAQHVVLLILLVGSWIPYQCFAQGPDINQAAVLYVNASETRKIPDTLFGIFFEVRVVNSSPVRWFLLVIPAIAILCLLVICGLLTDILHHMVCNSRDYKSRYLSFCFAYFCLNILWNAFHICNQTTWTQSNTVTRIIYACWGTYFSTFQLYHCYIPIKVRCVANGMFHASKI